MCVCVCLCLSVSVCVCVYQFGVELEASVAAEGRDVERGALLILPPTCLLHFVTVAHERITLVYRHTKRSSIKY